MPRTRPRSGPELNPQIRSIAAAAAHAKGLLDHQRKDLAEAVTLYEGGPRPLACAAALEDLGVATVEEGDPNEAARYLAGRWSCTPKRARPGMLAGSAAGFGPWACAAAW